ncbi:hypothetical protein Trydic_g2419 [Trypoxylus dichotomus]
MAGEIKELLKFMQLGARLDLKAYAVSSILGLTGTNEGIKLIIENPEFLISLLTLLNDNNEVISKESALSLVNISANEDSISPLLELDLEEKSKIAIQRKPQNIIKTVLGFILDKESHIADPCCMILSNLSRPSRYTDKVIELMQKTDITFDILINAFTKKKYNNKGANLHYLGPVLSNLSQSSSVRRYILDREKCVIQRLLPFTEYNGSHIRRGGVIGTLRNCCFDTEFHEWLLSEDVDILPRLLLPLAGNTEYDEEDNDKLPLELQYLSEDKKREEDPDIRCMLLEAITQLCAKRDNRKFIRNKNTYVILRELHKWESDDKALLACENLVDILIRTEEEIGKDNLKEMEIPDDLQEEFKKIDASSIPFQSTERRCIKRWVAPTLRELQRRRDRIGPPKPEPRSTYLEWNYNAEIFAFGKRLGEEFKEDVLRRALTHRSYTKSQEDKDGIQIDDNSVFIEKGYNIISSFLKQQFKEKYPHIIVNVLHDHLMTTEMLAYVASHIGLRDIVLCSDFPVEDTTMANTFASIVAALEISSGKERAEKFVKDILVAQLNGRDIYDVWKLDDAFGYLKFMLKDRDIEPRLCNESGVTTVLANYQVGLYSNKELLGIGFGETIDIAKHTAALDAIQRIYNKHNPSSL